MNPLCLNSLKKRSLLNFVTDPDLPFFACTSQRTVCGKGSLPDMLGTNTLICVFVSCCQRITCSVSFPAMFSSFIFAPAWYTCEIYLISNKQPVAVCCRSYGGGLFSLMGFHDSCSYFSAFGKTLCKEKCDSIAPLLELSMLISDLLGTSKIRNFRNFTRLGHP